jgi:hypothetical protein
VFDVPSLERRLFFLLFDAASELGTKLCLMAFNGGKLGRCRPEAGARRLLDLLVAHSVTPRLLGDDREMLGASQLRATMFRCPRQIHRAFDPRREPLPRGSIGSAELIGRERVRRRRSLAIAASTLGVRSGDRKFSSAVVDFTFTNALRGGERIARLTRGTM